MIDAAGFEDRADPHRNGPSRHVLLAEEIARRVHPRDAVERDQSRAAVGGRSRLIEADVPRAADPEKLQIEPARFLDLLLVCAAVFNDLFDRDRAVGHVRILRADVDQVEQMLAHETAIALQLERLDRKILVEVERDDVGETTVPLRDADGPTRHKRRSASSRSPNRARRASSRTPAGG